MQPEERPDVHTTQTVISGDKLLWPVHGRGKREIPEKTRRPAASSSTIPTCENPGATLGGGSGRSLGTPLRPTASSGTIPTCENTVTRPRIELGSPWWEASVLIAQPPWSRASVAKRLACSLPTKAKRAQLPAGSPDFRMWESCRTMPLVGEFSRGSPVSPALSFRRCSIVTSITLIGSKDLPNLSIPFFSRSASVLDWVSAGNAAVKIPHYQCGVASSETGKSCPSPWPRPSRVFVHVLLKKGEPVSCELSAFIAAVNTQLLIYKWRPWHLCDHRRFCHTGCLARCTRLTDRQGSTKSGRDRTWPTEIMDSEYKRTPWPCSRVETLSCPLHIFSPALDCPSRACRVGARCCAPKGACASTTRCTMPTIEDNGHRPPPEAGTRGTADKHHCCRRGESPSPLLTYCYWETTDVRDTPRPSVPRSAVTIAINLEAFLQNAVPERALLPICPVIESEGGYFPRAPHPITSGRVRARKDGRRFLGKEVSGAAVDNRDPCCCAHLIPPCNACRLARPPPTKANRDHCLAGSPDFCMWDSYRTMPLVGEFSRGSPVPPALSIRSCASGDGAIDARGSVALTEPALLGLKCENIAPVNVRARLPMRGARAGLVVCGLLLGLRGLSVFGLVKGPGGGGGEVAWESRAGLASRPEARSESRARTVLDSRAAQVSRAAAILTTSRSVSPPTGPGNFADSFGSKLDSTILCVLERKLVVHWLMPQLHRRPDITGPSSLPSTGAAPLTKRPPAVVNSRHTRRWYNDACFLHRPRRGWHTGRATYVPPPPPRQPHLLTETIVGRQQYGGPEFRACQHDFSTPPPPPCILAARMSTLSPRQVPEAFFRGTKRRRRLLLLQLTSDFPEVGWRHLRTTRLVCSTPDGRVRDLYLAHITTVASKRHQLTLLHERSSYLIVQLRAVYVLVTALRLSAEHSTALSSCTNQRRESRLHCIVKGVLTSPGFMPEGLAGDGPRFEPRASRNPGLTTDCAIGGRRENR
ncbi:hypothetical protein PR048_024966 [Dryococelus australis]|uniref:Uncharacterized protein n=1 Tax=Dryococelus australis TaxID=614101 RepID=A0ABQ9GQ26_9NEOP|nr:hypothetical protein PR048_024966 [Dryococelus australis]